MMQRAVVPVDVAPAILPHLLAIIAHDVHLLPELIPPTAATREQNDVLQLLEERVAQEDSVVAPAFLVVTLLAGDVVAMHLSAKGAARDVSHLSRRGSAFRSARSATEAELHHLGSLRRVTQHRA
jgi:hypothetical protein